MLRGLEMNEVPDSSLGRLGVLTPSTGFTKPSLLKLRLHPVFPTVAEDNEEIIPKLLKKPEIILLLSESQVLCHIFTTGLTCRGKKS